MMGAGHAVAIWFIASGVACILLLAWAAIIGFGTGRHRLVAGLILAVTATLALLPSGLVQLRRGFIFPYPQTLFLGATLCLFAAAVLLWRMRRNPDLQRSADLALAACLNLWIVLWVSLTPLANL